MHSISRGFFRSYNQEKNSPCIRGHLSCRTGHELHMATRLELIDKLDKMPNHRVNFNWSRTAPIEGQFKDDDLGFIKTAQS